MVQSISKKLGGAARNEGKKTIDGAIKSLGRRRMREGTLERWQLV